MNLALPAALFFVFLLPGFLLRDAFRRPEIALPDPTPFADRIISSFLLAALMHAAWCAASAVFTPYRIDWEALLLLVSADRGNAYEAAIHRISAHPEGPFWYLITLCAAARLLGGVPRQLIRLTRLDREGRTGAAWLRADTPWYYLFSGYDATPMPDAVLISAVVEVGKDAYLYVGRLVEYFLDRSGAIDRLVLEDVWRRPLGADRADVPTAASTPADWAAAEERFYRIEGDYFVLAGSEIRTLNIRYLQLEVDGEAQGDAALAASSAVSAQ